MDKEGKTFQVTTVLRSVMEKSACFMSFLLLISFRTTGKLVGKLAGNTSVYENCPKNDDNPTH